MRAFGRRTGILIILLIVNAAAIQSLDIQQDVVQKSQRCIGSSYCRGGEAPPCFDCSGFVRYVLGSFVPDLPRMSRDMARSGRAVSRSELRAGDLVFFATTSVRGAVSHVAIYIGQDSIIHAISDGPKRGVHVSSLNARYWKNHYHSAVRIFSETLGSSAAAADSSIGKTSTAEPIQFAKGSYTGELLNGEPHGTGRLEMQNGDVYEGEFREGEFDGIGVYRWAKGGIYEGEFRNGDFHGQGSYVSKQREDESASEKTLTIYSEEEASPWDTWDGYITGDFYAWKQQEEESFEEWKKRNSPGN